MLAILAVSNKHLPFLLMGEQFLINSPTSKLMISSCLFPRVPCSSGCVYFSPGDTGSREVGKGLW